MICVDQPGCRAEMAGMAIDQKLPVGYLSATVGVYSAFEFTDGTVSLWILPLPDNLARVDRSFCTARIYSCFRLSAIDAD
jgi:hypothetical protein